MIDRFSLNIELIKKKKKKIPLPVTSHDIVSSSIISYFLLLRRTIWNNLHNIPRNLSVT